MVFKQDIGIGIRMGIDTAPFWASLFLSFFFWSKNVQNRVSEKSTRTYKYHAISQFIKDLGAINNDDEFSRSLKCIYLGPLEGKPKHNGTRVISLDLDIKTE